VRLLYQGGLIYPEEKKQSDEIISEAIKNNL
jgi:hypothetical protein